MRTLIVIPARLASTRLPNKMLLNETGRTLIEHTYHSACTSRMADQVVIATDDERIGRVVEDFGGRAILTNPAHPSGTDRVAEVAAKFPEYDLIANVQGDEPEIEGETIDRAIQALMDHPAAQMSTVAVPLRDPRMLADVACVKVVVSQGGLALYFSRSPIPFARDPARAIDSTNPAPYFQHVGIYVYRREFLSRITSIPPTPLEVAESLEQLRVLESGYSIAVAQVLRAAKGIDTIEDYRAFVERKWSKLG